jgi:hypothetical protein
VEGSNTTAKRNRCFVERNVINAHCTAMQKLRIVTPIRDFGWEIAHGAVSRRPPISLFTIVARTGGYTHAASVWDTSLVQDQFLSPPAKPCSASIRNFFHRCTAGKWVVSAGDPQPESGAGGGAQHRRQAQGGGRRRLLHGRHRGEDVPAAQPGRRRGPARGRAVRSGAGPPVRASYMYMYSECKSCEIVT